nr:hypothetical protein HmN_000908500 [Hymenolepis microstoma]
MDGSWDVTRHSASLDRTLEQTGSLRMHLRHGILNDLDEYRGNYHLQGRIENRKTCCWKPLHYRCLGLSQKRFNDFQYSLLHINWNGYFEVAGGQQGKARSLVFGRFLAYGSPFQEDVLT